MVILRIIYPYYHLDFGIPSKVGHIDQIYNLLYILYLAENFVYLYFLIFYGLLVGHISSVLTLMLTVSFVDGSSKTHRTEVSHSFLAFSSRGASASSSIDWSV
jgi:hypothetical protein